jgi:hypothetical protein
MQTIFAIFLILFLAKTLYKQQLKLYTRIQKY